VRRSDVGRWRVLAVTGEIDLATLPKVRTELQREASRSAGESMPLMIDLTECDLIDSVGLGILVGAARRAREVGREFCVVAPHDPVARILRVSRVDEIIDVRTSATEGAPS
jgi:anti-anti-sigma factor